MYSFLADMVVAFHVFYVAFVVLGLLAIAVGALLRQSWVRNTWFRWIHLVMMGIVGLEAVYNITCPLTTLEEHLRELALQPVSEGSFLGRLLHDTLFVSWPVEVVNMLHVAFALLVVGTFVLAPPRNARLIFWMWLVTTALFFVARWALWPEFPQSGVVLWAVIAGALVMGLWGVEKALAAYRRAC
jgi:hypothetical protein